MSNNFICNGWLRLAKQKNPSYTTNIATSRATSNQALKILKCTQLSSSMDASLSRLALQLPRLKIVCGDRLSYWPSSICNFFARTGNAQPSFTPHFSREDYTAIAGAAAPEFSLCRFCSFNFMIMSPTAIIVCLSSLVVSRLIWSW